MTNRLTLTFHGICVLFGQEIRPNLPSKARFVLPRRHDVEWHGVQIGVHQPMLKISSLTIPVLSSACLTPGPDEQSWLLDGVTLRIATQPPEPALTGSPPCIPRLSEIWRDMQLDLEVVDNRKSPASVYFDLDAGQMANIALEGAAATTITIDYPDVVPVAVLQMTCWSTDDTQNVEIPLPATITITNTAKTQHAADNLYDFVLNYLVATELPPVGEWETIEKALKSVTECLGNPPVDGDDIGPGCSNSGYP